MAILSVEQIKQIVLEINQEAEKTRRAEMHRRHKIYLDGGKQYLIEQLQREFSVDAVKEMRLAPINLLKKIVNKKSTIYKEAPYRKANSEANQQLVDFYVKKLSLDQTMMKSNRYYNLFSNNTIYTRPTESGVSVRVMPPYLYSIVPNMGDQTKIESYVFSDFSEEGTIIPFFDLAPATGSQGYSRDRMIKEINDLVNSNEAPRLEDRTYILWTDEQHMTLDRDGTPMKLNPDLGDEQFINPIGEMPVVNVAQERDNSPWAMQGGDMVDVCLAAQLALSDVLSIAKHQGFSLLSIVSEEEPKNLKIGLNRAIWLKATEGSPSPKIEYVQASSPLDQYKQIILDLIGLLLSTNDMSVNSIGGASQTKNITSGFQALIEMSDTLEIIEQQKPVMKKAEQDLWKHISKWHNYLSEINALSDEERALGVFSDDFEIVINYKDIKPIESEKERIDNVKALKDLGLITKKDAVKKLNPDMTDEQVDQKLEEIDKEQEQNSNDVLVSKVQTINEQDRLAQEEQMKKMMRNNNGETVS